MKKTVECITDNLYTLSYYDDSWQSYNNMYFYICNKDIGFVDSGKNEHKKVIGNVLNEFNRKVSDVSWFIATHGHKDHIGGCDIFTNAEKFIHRNDFNLLPNKFKLFFKDIKNLDKVLNNVSRFEIIHLGHHTMGSIAVFDHELKVLFIGDHICFFGLPLSVEGVVCEGYDLRRKEKELIKQLIKDPKTYEKENLGLFFKKLKKLSKYNIKYLCTGHGIVIKNDVKRFIKEIIDMDIYS